MEYHAPWQGKRKDPNAMDAEHFPMGFERSVAGK
jgi:hypothetical protein